jgi:hypothetical protein
MLAAPPPKNDTPEEADIYKEILRKRIKILLEKAVKQWRRTLKFASRLNLKNHWVESTRADLEKIESLLVIERHAGEDLNIN